MWSFCGKICFYYREFEVADRENGPQTACDERILEDLLRARTPLQYISAIHHAKPTEEADTAPVVVSDAELPALPKLIIRDGESGRVLTQTKFLVTKFCAEHKMEKRTSYGLLCMHRKKEFVP